MKKNFKKIITSTALIIFLFGIFVPFNKTFSQTPSSVTLSVSTQTVIPGQSTTITATVSAMKGGQILSFFTTGSGYSFSQKTCEIPAIQYVNQAESCNVTFGSLDEGTFRINALIYANKTDFAKNNPIAIDIPGVDVTVKNPYSVITPQKTATTTDTTYTPLAPLPGEDKIINTQSDSTNPCPFGNYLNVVIKIVIGFAAVLAMVMIVMGGVEYMTSELVSGKEAGKETISHAILGLLIALGAYTILNTINPQLLNACLNNLPTATIVITTEDIGGEATTFDGKTTVKYIYSTTYLPNNSCPGQTGNTSATCIDLKTTTLPKTVYASLEKDTLAKITSFNEKMANGNIKWYITEGYPPTIQHASTCHTNGTCLDLNIENVTPEKIKAALDNLTAVGMCPNYEVMGGVTRAQLNAVGVSNDRIWNGKGTGAHIHVVNAKCG